MSVKDKKKQPKNFEEAITILEQIAEDLEKGDVGLEEAIEKYEEGITLTKYCNDKLKQAERKIEILQKGENGLITAKKIKVNDETGEILNDDEVQGSLL